MCTVLKIELLNSANYSFCTETGHYAVEILQSFDVFWFGFLLEGAFLYSLYGVRTRRETVDFKAVEVAKRLECCWKTTREGNIG